MLGSRKLVVALGALLAIVVGIFFLQTVYLQNTPVTSESPYPQVRESGETILGVFEGRVPCTGCTPADKMKILLVIYQDPETKKPTTYWLGRVIVRDNQTENPNRIDVLGTVKVRRGFERYPDAEVYELDTNAPEDLRLYWKVNDDVLLPLDSNMILKVGNASWGYMLSRTK